MHRHRRSTGVGLIVAVLIAGVVGLASPAQGASLVCKVNALAGKKNLAGCDLRNADLHGADLRSVNLAGAQLQGADLSDADLSGANLILANAIATDFTRAKLVGATANGLTAGRTDTGRTTFERANLSRAVLTGANLRWAVLTGANLSFATISNVEFGNSPDGMMRAHHVIGTPAQLNFGWQIRDGYIVGRSQDFSSTDLSGVDFSGLDLSYSSFADATLVGTDLESTRLDSASLRGAHLDGVDLSGAWVKDADLGEAVLVNSAVDGCDFRTTAGSLPMADGLRTSGLTGTARIPNQWKQLDGRFVGPQLVVRDANLAGVDLRGMDLAGVDISSSNLARADLRSANLHWASLHGNDLSNARLVGADVERLNSDGNTGRPASLPDGWVMRSGILIGPTADLRGVDARDANFRNVQFRDVNLADADISGATVTGARFADAWVVGMRSVDLVGTPASMPGSGWVMRGRTMATSPLRVDDVVARVFGRSVLTTWVATWAGGADTASVTVTAYTTRQGSAVAWRCVIEAARGDAPTACQRDGLEPGRYWIVVRQVSSVDLVSALTDRVRVTV